MNKKIIEKNYGSIPHMSISKIDQQTEKYIERGQEDIATKKARDYNDLIIVQEKVDGSNVGVFMGFDEKLYPITRSGHSAITSPFKQHHYFHKWVFDNEDVFREILNPGERICGEWMLQTHSIRYKIIDLFIAFDIICEKKRMTYIEFIKRTSNFIQTANLVHIGQPISIKNAIKKLGVGGHGSVDEPEGLVYRVERNGEVDFLCKYVRPNLYKAF